MTGRRWLWWSVGALVALLAGCGGGGPSGGGTIVVDNNYNFTTAGAVAGVNVRTAGRGLLKGRLFAAGGQGVAGVTVTLYRLTTSNSRQVGSLTTLSDATGNYVFGNLEIGSYRLRVQTQSADVTVVANQDTSANFSNVVDPSNGGQPPAQFKWTVMIFMNADNDLEPYGVQDVNELEMLPDSDDVAFIVIMDRIRGFDTSNGNWTDTRRFRIRHDNDTNLMTSALSVAEGGQAEVLGELDTGDKDVLKAFIAYCQQHYPAERYLLDIWNHGAGWRSRAAELGPIGRGVLFDDTSNTYITTPELDAATEASTPLDIIAFDSSLMQMIEVAYQIRQRCELVVGSEESPPGEGYPYNEIFAALVANPNMTAEALAANIVNRTAETTGLTNSITQSALRTARLPALAAAVSAFGDALAAKNATYNATYLTARTATQRYGSGSSLYEGNRDLIDFGDQIVSRTNDPELTSAHNAVREALTAALVAERHTGSGLARSNGVAIFIPSATGWNDLRTSYRQTAFARDTRWDEWLDVLHGRN